MHFLKCNNEHISNSFCGSASSSSALLRRPYGVDSASNQTGCNAAVPRIVMVHLYTLALDAAQAYNKMPVCSKRLIITKDLLILLIKG